MTEGRCVYNSSKRVSAGVKHLFIFLVDDLYKNVDKQQIKNWLRVGGQPDEWMEGNHQHTTVHTH